MAYHPNIQRQTFDVLKQQCLAKEDLSRKGSIDEPIRALVETINANKNFYTTSTCSGRITVISKPIETPQIKKGCKFLLNSHQAVDFREFMSVYSQYAEDPSNHDCCLWLKFEPFVLHVQCIDLMRAKNLLDLSIGMGCRNSGATFGKNDKTMVAIRSTSSMEVPIFDGSGRFELSEKYLRFLCDESNRRLENNLERLGRLQREVKTLLDGMP